MNKSIIAAAIALILTACAGELTREKAAEAIASQTEFQTPIYAPMHFATHVLTGENHTDPKAYIRSKYGVLIDQGLLVAKLGASNSWRTILNIELTDKGLEMEDADRRVDDMLYMQACRMAVDSVLLLEPVGSGDTILCRYQISQRELTPFGTHLGFTEGRTHLHERRFVKGTFSWELVPMN